MKHIFITYGDAAFEKAKAKIVMEAADTKEFDSIISYGYEDLSLKLLNSSVIKEKRGGGLWSWKPDIILTTMNQYNDGDIIVYCDAGCTLYSSPEWRTYWKKLENADLIAQRIFQRNDHWTRKEIFTYFDFENTDIEKCYQYQATIIIKISSFTKKLVSEWRDLMIEHPEFAMDVPKNLVNRQHRTFIENRHDQAIYSALIYKYLSNPRTKCKIYTQWEHIEDNDLFFKQAIRATRLRYGQNETVREIIIKSFKRLIKDYILKPFYYTPLQSFYTRTIK